MGVISRSFSLDTFAQFGNINEAMHQMVTALRPVAGMYADGVPVSQFTYADIQRVYDGASHVIIGQLASRPHPILSVILPAKVSDKIQHSVTTTELLYTLPVLNPYGGTNQSMQEKETVEWFHSKRYGIHFWLEGDYVNTPEGQFKLAVNLTRAAAYLNERGITEGYKALLQKPPHQLLEETGNRNPGMSTKNTRGVNRDDFFAEIERRNYQTALFHKDPIGIHKALENVTDKIQDYTYREIVPDCAILPTMHAQILTNSSEYLISYDKGGPEAVARLNSNKAVVKFKGLDIYYAPTLMIDNKRMKHPARRDKVHGEFGFLDTLLHKQINMYDVSIDQDRTYTESELVDICNKTWCDPTSPISGFGVVGGAPAGNNGTTYTIKDARGAAIPAVVAGNADAPLGGLGFIKNSFLPSFESQIFPRTAAAANRVVNLVFHGFLCVQPMAVQSYMAVPFQKAGCGSVYFTRIHRSNAEDAVHQTEVYNATQHIGVAMKFQKHRWVLDDLIYAGIGGGTSKDAIMDAAKYKKGPPQHKKDPGLYVLPIFAVQSATVGGAQIKTPHLIEYPRKYFADEPYFDIRGKYDCDAKTTPPNYLLAETFLTTTGVDDHIKQSKAANIMFRCTQMLYGKGTNPNKQVPSSGPHGTYEAPGHALVRSEGKSLYKEAQAQVVSAVRPGLLQV